MSTHEVIIAFEFLYATLSGDSTLASYATNGIWRGMAPVSTQPPFVVMGFMSGTDTLTGNRVRLLSNPLIQVKASGPSSMTTQLGQAASQIDTLLKRVSGTTSDGLIHSCYQESPLMLESLVNGVQWTDIGGLYRLQIQSY